MRIKVTKLNDHIYLLDDAGESTAYLIIGTKKALLLDTMNGIEDPNPIIRKYTDLPLMVVDTHGHPDHIYGNIFFDEVYMNPDDWYVADEVCKDPNGLEVKNTTGREFPVCKDILPGEVIDLGDLHLDVIGLAGHTPGSLLFLLKEDRILFVGDSINHHLWMQLHHCTSLEMFRDNLSKVMYLTEEADYILHGHATGFDDIALLSKTYRGVEEILAGETENDEPYTWFGGGGKTHKIPDDDGVICYTPESDWIKNEKKNWAASDAKRDEGLVEPSDVKAYKDISYNLFGIHSLLDVYVPDSKKEDELLPVLINVHGGGYFYGDKELYRFYAMDMSRFGFVVINFNYRLSPAYKFPSPLQDLNEVLRWLEANGKEYGCDISNVFLMGDSAGAQISSNYAAINSNPDFAALYALKPTKIKIKGVSLACGMYDMASIMSEGNPDEYRLNYYAEYLTPGLPIVDVYAAITENFPPAFVFSCPNDFLYDKCEPMAKFINERGGRAVSKIYGTKEMKDVAHVFHCNMKLDIGAEARKDQAEFLLSLCQ